MTSRTLAVTDFQEVTESSEVSRGRSTTPNSRWDGKDRIMKREQVSPMYASFDDTEHISSTYEGRVKSRRAYGAWRIDVTQGTKPVTWRKKACWKRYFIETI